MVFAVLTIRPAHTLAYLAHTHASFANTLAKTNTKPITKSLTKPNPKQANARRKQSFQR